MKKNKIIVGISALVAFLVGSIAYANPSLFAASAKTATATTTLAFLTPGAATTTIIYDTRAEKGTNQTSDGNYYVADAVFLKEYIKASSTATVLVTNVEFSDDKIDWFQNNQETYAAGTIAIVTPNSYTWTFATSTIGGTLNGIGTDVGAKLIKINVPTRYVRVVLSVTGANAGVWAEILPKKQIIVSN